MTGLILEGGGMRGAFTAGVLDAFLENNLHFDSVYGVSAGASNGASYIARQPGRNRKVFVDRVGEYKYFSIRHLLSQRNLLDVKLLFNTYPNSLLPFDYESFESSPSKFYTVLTDCLSGEPVYIERSNLGRDEFMMKVLAGSNSLPLLSPSVKISGRPCLDGGISDSIPLRRAEKDGCRKNVVILTREEGYRKSESGLTPLIRTVYRRWPLMAERFAVRHTAYNETLDYCESRRQQGTAILIRPETTMSVSRTETDTVKLRRLYDHGFSTGEKRIEEIFSFLDG